MAGFITEVLLIVFLICNAGNRLNMHMCGFSSPTPEGHSIPTTHDGLNVH